MLTISAKQTGVNNRKLALVGIIPNQILFSFPGFDSQQVCAVFFRLIRHVSSSIFVGAEREENLIRV